MSVQRILDKKGERLITLPCDSVIADITKTLSAERIGTVMLVDEKSGLVGIFSERDLVRFITEHGCKALEMRVNDLMTQSVITCTPETSLEDALALMSIHTIRHLPVVSNGKALGLISARDILDYQRERMAAEAEKSKMTEQNFIQSQKFLEDQSRKIEETAQFLAEARNQAETANRAKSEFLATVSHELRTPLNAIIGFSEVMQTEALGPIGSPQYREYAKDINDSGLHLLALINDILDLSKAESGKDELHEENIEILGVICAITTLVRERARQGGIEIELAVEEGLPRLRADERKMKQILANLLTNAIKFTETSGKITLRAWCNPESGYVIQVADTGIGIAPEDIGTALSQFGQVDSNHNRQYEGTGLGLPLTKALVELHGGTLDLQSDVGIGTTVTVRFPAERIVASLDNLDSLDVAAS